MWRPGEVSPEEMSDPDDRMLGFMTSAKLRRRPTSLLRLFRFGGAEPGDATTFARAESGGASMGDKKPHRARSLIGGADSGDATGASSIGAGASADGCLRSMAG